MAKFNMQSKFLQGYLARHEINAARVIVGFSGILILVIWSVLFIKLESEKQAEIDYSIKANRNLVDTFEEHTLRILDSANQITLFMKYQYEREGALINMSPYRTGGLSLQPYVLLSIADEQGNLVVSNQEKFVFSNISDREHFLFHKTVDSDRLFISKPVFGRSSGKWSIQMTRRINKPDGSFGGVVVVSLDPYYFMEFYRQMDLGKRASVELIGHDGIVRAWWSDQLPTTEQDIKQVDPNLLLEMTASDTGHYIAQSAADGVRRIYSYRALRDYPLIVHMGVAESEVLYKYYQRQNIYYSVACLLSLFIIGSCVVCLKMKKIEAQFSRLERLNLIGEMAASIGHEIRNPMTTVRGFLQLLGRKPEFSKSSNYFQVMIQEIDRANSIITEYLSLAKDKAIEKKLVNLNDIIAKLYPLIQADAMMQHKYILKDLSAIPQLYLDEKEICQLILNLVRNGLEAMESDGKVIIRTYVDNADIVMAIQDEGQGMDANIHDKVGTPFFTTKENGTGLGLAVCFSIATRHDAKLDFESGTDGTTFFIRFPRDFQR